MTDPRPSSQTWSPHEDGKVASSPPVGLTQAEAERRLAAAGPNALPTAPRRGAVRIVLETLREPMFLLLMAATGLYLLLGDLAEGLFLLTGAGAAIGLVVAQEARSERALAALREIAQPMARVIRDGRERRLPARDLAPGDLILVGEGERLPADGRLVSGEALLVDESTLTGESAPVAKRPGRPGDDGGRAEAPGAELSPWLFAGTLLVRGQGTIEVLRTGPQTALGQVGAALAAIPHEPTPLQKAARRVVSLLGVFALAYCAIVATTFAVMRDDWVGGALAGLTAAIALVPEEFPMVLAVFLALGAWRLATHQVLVRRSAVIETLGAATVLCVDKTGTLTENRMTVARLWTPTGEVELQPRLALPDPAARLLDIAALACAAQPTDPMDRAIRASHAAVEPGVSPRPGPVRTWPLEAARLAVVQAWAEPEGGWRAATKGAPEAVFNLCGLSGEVRAGLVAEVERLATEGLRVLAVAEVRGEGPLFDVPEEVRFTPAGLIGFRDPLRSDVPAAVQAARAAGLTVVMITGDHRATALATAEAAGLDIRGGVMLGSELEALSLAELQARLGRVRVFARIQPEQKLRLVEALKANGHVVTMTGDGVNDAPALEAAHVGVAMGRRGADVAREAADLVLLDDSFASIVGGVRLGRRIFANLRKALIYVTAIHVPIAGLALGPILLGLPPFLLPMHVVLLELAIDPMCTLVFEAEPSASDAMTRPPRPAREPLFGPRQLALSVAQGLVVLAAVLGLYVWALSVHSGPEARGAAFAALVIGNLTMALVDTGAGDAKFLRRPRILFLALAAVITALLAAVLAVPPLAKLFQMQPPPADLLLAAIGLGVMSGGVVGWAQGLVVRLAQARASRLPMRS